ncbi:DUF2333 family protein [Vibrio sp. 10N.261.46.E12]|uniref:DUF2333 family protein n=1 Tax=unclassified Vibrio TaxID=2614977 RepID=UPI0009773F87|nr:MULTISPECIES: DUF2333 family protein [unclassified Vibrio]OMO36469.1 hypothetical protein BH584_04075 [Vibrio sp. 10N.261.45.E1]PMJ22135.1 hypothetical protein BCU27_17115 [Vibrio sp. 10N.286.45.B6]PML97421.1 hypothetical protein BCT66_21085 [Vibrio sp. 10N.261.49.E11]PMM76553.1 hypothetical protein BCT48_01940 [Vibrio sp. 10N.261.46.F12]PMM82488.1 hypothetical protein BCT46_14145 [Vibrio sp. 10N.261.46.E8]
MNDVKDKLSDLLLTPAAWLGSLLSGFMATLLFVGVVFFIQEPDNIDVAKHQRDSKGLLGYTTAATVEDMLGTLLDKPFGYVSNDILPPFILLDDIPSWEQGVIVQLQNITLAMQRDFSRPGNQTKEDPDLTAAKTLLNNDTKKWIATDYQTKLSKARAAMNSYKTRLQNDNPRDGQFTSKSTSLKFWLGLVDKNLGDLSTQLGANRGQIQVNSNLAGEKGQVAWAESYEVLAQTPWSEIDNVYWNARGQTWALLAAFMAIRTDFDVTLQDKSATSIVDQVIRTLHYALRPIDSPYVFNGSRQSYGFTPNYSSQLSSDINAANNGVRELLNLLDKG